MPAFNISSSPAVSEELRETVKNAIMKLKDDNPEGLRVLRGIDQDAQRVLERLGRRIRDNARDHGEGEKGMTVRRSTAFGFMAAVVTTLVIGQLVLAVWFLIYEKETYRKAREASSTMEAKFLAEYSAEYLKSGERANLDSFVSALRADTDMLSIQIRRSDGLVLLNERLGEEPDASAFSPFYIPGRNAVHAQIRSGGAVRPVRSSCNTAARPSTGRSSGS